MPDPDFSSYSDEQLQAIIDADQKKQDAASTMSDADLQAIANKSDVGTGEALARGAGQGFLFNFEPQVASAASLAAMSNPFGPATIDGQTPYELSKAVKEQEITRNKTAEQQHGGAYLTGSVLGNVANPINYMLPEAKAGASLLSNVGRVAAPQAAMAAVSGYGAGDTTDQSLHNAATGTLLGGGLGAVAGAISHAISAPSLEAFEDLKKFSPEDIKAAADKLGIQVPTYILGGEPAQAVAAGVKNIPFAGKPLTNATESVLGQLGKTVDTLGGVTDRAAGLSLKGALTDWTGTQSKKIVQNAYNNVDNFIKNPDTLTPLSNTNSMISDIVNRRTTAAIPGKSDAVSAVADAASRDEGLPYEGIKNLRSYVGQLVENSKGSDPELKQIYSSLTADLEKSIQNSNLANPDKLDALAAWKTANETASDIKNQKEQISKIIGKQGADTPAEDVFTAAKRAAGTGRGADQSLLSSAMGKVSPEVWQDFAGGVVNSIAKDANQNFSPNKFLGPQGYNSLSDGGKYLLFGPPGTKYRDSLDALATLSAPAQEMQKHLDKGIKYGALAYAAFNHPLTVATSLFGGKSVANMLAQPATAESLANWSRLYNAAQTTGQVSGNALAAAAASLNRTYSDAYGSTLSYVPGVHQVAKAAGFFPNEQRQGHAAGGKVISSDSLIRNAEMAKNRINKNTEPLLGVPDETITKALALANKAI